MTSVKEFKSYEEQADLLVARGMTIDDREAAISKLREINYYRLSGYWYPFRKLDSDRVRKDQFFPGTTFVDVLSLYDFDSRLRTATFDALAPVELTLRALLGYELAEIDESAHLRPELLGARAQSDSYAKWLAKYSEEIGRSHEVFVAHHREHYSGLLPVWAAVEILNLGSLRHLYGFSPRIVQDRVADGFGLRAPQLESWIRALEIIRNACAHHGRLYNRVYTKSPKLPPVGRYPDLDIAGPSMTRTFGQLTLIQHMRDMRGIGRSRVLAAALASYPSVKFVPKSHAGMPEDWNNSTLWAR